MPSSIPFSRAQSVFKGTAPRLPFTSLFSWLLSGCRLHNLQPVPTPRRIYIRKLIYIIYITECIVCVSGYDPLSLTFSFLSFLLFDWVGVLWPQLSKVLKLVCWARRVHGGGDSSVVRAPDSWLKGRGFESLLERRENFLLQGRLSVLTLLSVSVPPPCYHSST